MLINISNAKFVCSSYQQYQIPVPPCPSGTKHQHKKLSSNVVKKVNKQTKMWKRL